ncbi:MAG: pyruvate kinase [archaeon]
MKFLKRATFKRTKILCTIGPVSMDAGIMKKLFEAGMDGVRINTAHGDFAQYDQILANARSIAELPILVDIKGPEVRTRVSREIQVSRGTLLDISLSGDCALSFSYNFLSEVKTGARIFIEDGKLSGMLEEVDGRGKGKIRFETPGILKDRKNVNIPGYELKVPLLSEKDLKSIAWAVENEVEFIALSFVRSAGEVENLRKHIPKGSRMKIISKVEDENGVKRIDEIIAASDGIMIARGDLGVEIPPEKIPLFQKGTIAKCNRAGKIVITATQMLDSMVERPRPTRAETSDVANAVLDGTDVVMLSGETSAGKYPVEAVREMARISAEVEPAIAHNIENSPAETVSDAIGAAIDSIIRQLPVTKIVAITKSGYSAAAISRYKPKEPIIAITPDPVTYRQMKLVWGVNSILFLDVNLKHKISSSIEFLVREKILSEKDLAVFTAGARTKRPKASNIIEVHYVKDLVEFFSEKEANGKRKKS